MSQDASTPVPKCLPVKNNALVTREFMARRDARGKPAAFLSTSAARLSALHVLAPNSDVQNIPKSASSFDCTSDIMVADRIFIDPARRANSDQDTRVSKAQSVHRLVGFLKHRILQVTNIHTTCVYARSFDCIPSTMSSAARSNFAATSAVWRNVR